MVLENQVYDIGTIFLRMKKMRYSPDGQVLEMTEEDKKIIDYWNYLSGDKAWHSEQDGLLHILRDMFHYNTLKDLSDSTNYISQNILITLNQLSSRLDEEQSNCPQLDFSNLILIVNSCREAISSNLNIHYQDVSIPQLNNLVYKLREYVLEEKLTLEETFYMFDADKDTRIDANEFRRGITSLLNNIPGREIENAFMFIDSDGDGSITFAEFSNKLRSYFYKPKNMTNTCPNTYMIGEPTNRVKVEISELKEDFQIKLQLEDFIRTFAEHCKDEDLSLLVNKIRRKFVDPAIKGGEIGPLTKFVTKLGTAFKKNTHKIYLLSILRKLIPQKMQLISIFDQENETIEQNMNELKKTQEILSQAGVLELALSIISNEHNFKLTDEAISLINAMLDNGNSMVQNKLLNLLKTASNSHLFSYIRSQLRLSRDRIVESVHKTYKNNPGAALAGNLNEDELIQEGIFVECASPPQSVIILSAHVKSLVRLIQLCCENCYKDFQHFLRTQEDSSNNKRQLSINMVNELAQFLINIKEVGPQLYNDYEARELIPVCFDAMIDLCKGPCIENQLLLGTKRKVYKFINSILGFKRQNDIHKDYFESAVKYIKALIEGKINWEIGEMMIQEIDFKGLAETSLDIYIKYVIPNLKFVIQERIQDETYSHNMISQI